MLAQKYGIYFVFPNFAEQMLNKKLAVMKWTILFLTATLLSSCGQRADAARGLPTASDSAGVPELGVPGAVADLPSENTGADGTPTRIQDKVELDKTVHDFGDVLVGAGSLECSFSVKNISDSPIAIYDVATSCGCAGAEWPREPIQPGRTGVIRAVYKNEDGPYPFDKTLTVRISALSKPVILRLRGVVHEKQRPLAELYPERRGALGLRGDEIKIGNLEQGESRSVTQRVANLGNKALTLDFADVAAGLEVSVRPNPVPPGSTAELSLTANASRERWGKQWYELTPVVDGRREKPFRAWTFTKENFASWTAEQRDAAARPIFESSSCSFGLVPAGTTVQGTFSFTNKGRSPLVFYSADSDTPGVRFTLPGTVPAGGKGSIGVSFDTAALPKGETTVILTFTTNSPLRPIVNLFLVGILQ